MSIRNKMTEKLYDYLDLDINNIYTDSFHDYLTENKGRDNEHYWWYMDETKSAAINKITGEIISDSERLDDLFA